jgi:phosphoglucosamine mutase
MSCGRYDVVQFYDFIFCKLVNFICVCLEDNMRRLFGTDGIRGVVFKDLTPSLCYDVGRAASYVLSKNAPSGAKILIGKDTRISGDMLEASLVSGICAAGADVVLAGVIPTPAIAYLVKSQKFTAGVMISASHNPFEYNGIKFFNENGYKLNDDVEEEIENLIENNGVSPIERRKIGCVRHDFAIRESYINYVCNTIDADLNGMKIAVDFANGSSIMTAKDALQKLGATIFSINDKPNGTNINFECGSTHIDAISKFTREVNADLGLAFDGDGDRLLAVDENGVLVDGDRIMSICALDMKSHGTLKKDTVVATVMSNLGLFLMGKKHGINVVSTNVGDRYVLEEMLVHGYNLGGEQSGHIIFLDYNMTGDGLITALQLLSCVRRSGKKLSELAGVMTKMPQVLVNAIVNKENKHAYLKDEEIKEKISDIESEFEGSGRVLVRPSGTENLVRVMIEGESEEEISVYANNLADLISKKFG